MGLLTAARLPQKPIQYPCPIHRVVCHPVVSVSVPDHRQSLVLVLLP